MKNPFPRPGRDIPLRTPESDPELFKAVESAKRISGISFLTPRSLREIEMDVLLIANIRYEYSLEGPTTVQMDEILSLLSEALSHFHYERARIGARIRKSTLDKLEQIKNLP